ncbi:MAG: PilZ domain-containing protein [Desulfobacterales bacterium]
MKSDRRSHQRFKPPQSGLFIRDVGSAISGWIIDMSMSGLAFDYYPTESLYLPSFLSIDISEAEHGEPILHEVSCRTVYDAQVLSENRSFKHGVELRRCGLAFSHPSEAERAKLSQILAGYQMDH